MDKQQRLLVVANGLAAGMVAAGETQFDPVMHEFESDFRAAWGDWLDGPRRAQLLTLDYERNRPRNLLFRLHRSKSPFRTYQTEPLTALPCGLEPVEFLEIYAEGADPQEWIDLAAKYLRAARG